MSKNPEIEKNIQRHCNRLKEIKEIARSVFQPPDIDFKKLESIIYDIGKSWSQSNLGYHARVYYDGLEQPPSNALFNPVCGLTNMGFIESIGDWQLYDHSEIVDTIFEEAGISQNDLIELGSKYSDEFEELKENSLNQIEILEIKIGSFEVIKKFKKQISSLTCLPLNEIRKVFLPKGQLMTRDPQVDGKFYVAPHQEVDATRIIAINPFKKANELSNILERIIDFAESMFDEIPVEKLGSKIFIGHGRSLLWREVKDFIQDRLNLDWDEFNRVPQAGYSTKERLEEMLSDSNFALLIHTAEDENKDGKFVARQNVIHETGLFQGKLGFKRAIILKEEGCQEFSNIHGLTQIQFNEGNISSSFEDIRKILEREKIIR